MDTRILKLEAAQEIEASAKALLPLAKVRVTEHDTYHLLPDGEYSDVYPRYAVVVELADDKTGNLVRATIDEVGQDVHAMLSTLMPSLRKRAAKTHTAIAAETEPN